MDSIEDIAKAKNQPTSSSQLRRTTHFFNTGIYTYLWVLNKNKEARRQDKVMLINASEKFKPLKKSKGAKRKEVDAASRREIVETLTRYEDNDYARIFDKEFFYFNKQAIQLTNVDENGKSLAEVLGDKKSLKLKPVKLWNGERVLSEFVITEYDPKPYDSLADYFEKNIQPFVASLDYKEQGLVIETKKERYCYDTARETLIKAVDGREEMLGCGKIVVKASFKKAAKTQPAQIEIIVELTPDYQKDYEIIPFHRDETENQQAIEAFMAKYITRPFEYLDNVVGVEINFNKVFYQPEKLREVSDILSEIEEIDAKLKCLEEALSLW